MKRLKVITPENYEANLSVLTKMIITIAEEFEDRANRKSINTLADLFDIGVFADAKMQTTYKSYEEALFDSLFYEFAINYFKHNRRIQTAFAKTCFLIGVYKELCYNRIDFSGDLEIPLLPDVIKSQVAGMPK